MNWYMIISYRDEHDKAHSHTKELPDYTNASMLIGKTLESLGYLGMTFESATFERKES